MKPGSTTTTTENAIFERVYLNAILGTDRINLFVNSDTGSDLSPNNGTQDLPYATIPRALSDVPTLQLTGAQICIYCEGVATFLLPDGFTLPQLSSPGRIVQDLAQPELFAVQGFGPLNLIAVNTLVQTIDAPDVVAQNTDPTSNLLTVVTNLALTPFALSRLFVVDAIGSIAAIVENDATDIKIVFPGTMNLPLQIFSRPTLANEVVASFNPTLRVRQGSCEVVLAGFDIEGGFPGFVPSLLVYAANVQAYGCRFKGGLIAGIDFASNSPSNGAFVGLGCVYETVLWQVAGIGSYDGYFDTVDFNVSAKAAMVFVNAGVFDGGSAPFFGAQLGSCPVSLHISNAELRKNDGIRYSGPELLLENVLISDSNNDGILLEQSSAGRLSNVSGTGQANYGLNVQSGSQMQVGPAIDITGALGDIQVGDNPIQTWVVFYGVGNEVDSVVQLARLWQGS